MIKGESRKAVLWVLIARPIILSTVLGGEVILAKSSALIPPTSFFYLLVVSYLLSLLYLGLWRFLPVGLLMWIQIIGDVALISSITRISGGANSPLSLLYFLVIIYASIFLLAKGGLLSAFVASFSYSFTLLIGSQTGENLLYLFYRVYMHVLLFFLVGAMSGYLAERLKRRALELNEIRLTTDEILQNMSSGLMSFDGDGKISYFNRRAEEILELSIDETKGRSFDELPERLHQLKNEISAHLKNLNITRRKEIEIFGKDGSKKQIGFNMSSFLDSVGKVKGVLILFQDVTERKYTERLALLGELSASMAHEIRNPLGSIRGATEVLGETLKVEKDTKRLMDLILRESDRVNRKIEEFLFLAKPREPVLRKTQLRRPINQVISLLKYHPSYSRKIKIKKSLGRKIPPVKGDEELLKQVFHNISINAMNAMYWEGELRISAVQDDDMVGVSFEDTGKGIKPEELESIFKPFYSGDGKGIGLGLAIANEIVRQHLGRIEVSSVVGKGSKFTVWLPKVS